MANATKTASKQQASKKSAKPGTPDESAKKVVDTDDEIASKRRIVYTDQFTDAQKADPDIYPFKATPDDFDWEQHRPLKKRDFDTDHAFYSHKAEECAWKSEHYKKLATECQTAGSRKDAAEIKKLAKMMKRMSALKEKLGAAGVDVEDMLKKLTDA